MTIGLSACLPEALLVDLPEIDSQHEEIFSRIELLKAGCFESRYVDIAESHALLTVFEQHFATEERIAEESGLDFSAHAKTHRDTLFLLRKALGDVLSGAKDAHSFLRYAEFWFERHIREDDKRFVATLLESQRFHLPISHLPTSDCRFSTRA